MSTTTSSPILCSKPATNKRSGSLIFRISAKYFANRPQETLCSQNLSKSITWPSISLNAWLTPNASARSYVERVPTTCSALVMVSILFGKRYKAEFATLNSCVANAGSKEMMSAISSILDAPSSMHAFKRVTESGSTNNVLALLIISCRVI